MGPEHLGIGDRKFLINRLIQQAWGQLSTAQQNDLAATMRQNGWTS